MLMWVIICLGNNLLLSSFVFFLSFRNKFRTEQIINEGCWKDCEGKSAACFLLYVLPLWMPMQLRAKTGLAGMPASGCDIGVGQDGRGQIGACFLSTQHLLTPWHTGVPYLRDAKICWGRALPRCGSWAVLTEEGCDTYTNSTFPFLYSLERIDTVVYSSTSTTVATEWWPVIPPS